MTNEPVDPLSDWGTGEDECHVDETPVRSTMPAADDGCAVVRDASLGRWLRFSAPLETVVARSVVEVVPALEKIQARVDGDGLHAAGFVAYEAAPAFDSALTVRHSDGFPLVWFTLYEKAEPFDLPDCTESAGPLIFDWQPSVAREAYYNAIRRIRNYIRDGHTYQVNFTFRLTAGIRTDPWNLFLSLISGQECRFSAYLKAGPWTVMSASPELFFRLDGDSLVCRPMKGTAPRGLTGCADRRISLALRNSEKNRAENLMIVDMVRNDMGRIAGTGTVRVKRLFELERYPTLWHMTSTVECKTDASLLGLFAALFPPASVTGAPKPRTMGIIAEMETGPRRIYTGAIGFLSPGRIAQFNVAIRTLVADMDKRTAEYGLGSGIVWDSESRSEYDECLLKAQILFRNRPAFRLLETMRWSPDQGYTLLDSHLRRMEESADYFGFRFTRESIVEALSAYAHGLAPNAAKVRALLSRHGDLTCESEPLVQTDRPAPVRVCVAKSAVDISNPFLYHKTTYRAVYEEAKRDNPRADDVILWNNRGEVTESTVANVVVELDGELFTPPVSSGLLAGTYRAWLLDNRRVRERVIKTDELKKCSRLLLVNSVQGEREAVLEPHPEPVL